MEKELQYALVTPVRNEVALIEKTIHSVISQTVRPTRWVIVSDGSTDGTDDVVKRHTALHPWITLIRMPERRERNFAGKIRAFNAGYATLRDVDYDAIGCLDGDISFNNGYFEFLLGKLATDSALGLVGTPYRDPFNQSYDYRYVSIEHVTGPCQLFRRQCFEQIGGYVPAKGGAVDRIADIAVRMKGWKTQTFTDRFYLHHRPSGTAQQNVLMSRFKDGAKDYSVGSSVLWEIFRAAYQMRRKPVVLGGMMIAAGYIWSMARRVERPVAGEMVKFCRREQMARLKALLFPKIPSVRSRTS